MIPTFGLDRISAKSKRRVEAIDACYGWIDGGDGQAGLRALQEAGVRAIRISHKLESALSMGLRHFLTRTWADGSRPHHTMYKGRHPRPYDLLEMSRVHLARRMRSPRAGWHPAQYCEPAEMRRAYCAAASIIDRTESFFEKASRSKRPPVVFVEGGLDLFAAAIREVAVRYGLEVIALENSWLPETVVCSWSGIAVNRLTANSVVAEKVAHDDLQLQALAGMAEEALVKGRSGVQMTGRYPRLDERGRPVVLVLGQIPYDAAIVDQNPDEIVPHSIPRLVRRYASQRTSILYRPHPEDGSQAKRRVKAEDPRTTVTGQVTLGEEICLTSQAGGPSAVVTANSQAGWQAAMKVPVFTLAPSWYSHSRLVRGPLAFLEWLRNPTCSLEDPAARKTQWLRETKDILAKHHILRSRLTERIAEIVKNRP